MGGCLAGLPFSWLGHNALLISSGFGPTASRGGCAEPVGMCQVLPVELGVPMRVNQLLHSCAGGTMTLKSKRSKWKILWQVKRRGPQKEGKHFYFNTEEALCHFCTGFCKLNDLGKNQLYYCCGTDLGPGCEEWNDFFFSRSPKSYQLLNHLLPQK
jgi:hypothetical protein